MQALSAANLATMRAQAQALMPESWSLVHPTSTPGDLGDTEAWAVTASGTAQAGTGARLMPIGYQAAEQIIAMRPGATTAWNITLPVGTNVAASDRVIIGAALAAGAAVTWKNPDESPVYPQVYEVIGDSQGHSYEAAVRVSAVGV